GIRSYSHDEFYNFRRHLIETLEPFYKRGCGLFGNERQSDADDESEEHQVEHIRGFAGDRRYRILWHGRLHNLHQRRVRTADVFVGIFDPFHGVRAVAFGQLLRGFRVDALARFDRVGETNPDHDGYGRDDEGVDEGFQSYTPDLADIADACNSYDERREYK